MATIGDVAREAGVSISTVSYALSGKRAITEETRTRVLAAARRLGYAPQAAARALAARRSDILAVTSPLHADTDHNAHMAFAMAVTRAARARDYDTLLLVHDDALEGMRRSAATSLADGIVVLDVASDDPRADLARTLDCPVVFIGLPTDTAGLTCVDLDFELATRQAVDALADAGHASVGLVSQRRETLARHANYPLRIEQAFVRRAEERGLAYAIVHPDSPRAEGPVAELLTALPDLTGLVLSSLAGVAATLVPALAARGLQVPDDVSVVAVGMTPDRSGEPLPFDQLPLDPGLTCPAAVDLLVGLIDGSAPAGAVILVPAVYQHHGTVAPARARTHDPTASTSTSTTPAL